MIRTNHVSFAVLTAALALGCGSSSTDTPAAGGSTNSATGGSTAAAGAGGSTGTGGATGGDGGSTTAPGTGGTTGTAGSSGTGRCAGLATSAAGTAGMIDDFEDGNITLSANEGRNGTWLLTGDTGCTLAPSPLAPEAPLATTTTKNSSTKALHVSGAGCSSYGFSVSATFVANPTSPTENWECGYDVSAYDGIYFWATGTNAISATVSVGMLSTIPKRVGGDGSCELPDGGGGCYDAWASVPTISDDWKLISFKWGDLMQAGWSGMAIPWNPKIVSELAFGIGKDDSATKADLWIDNVGFFKGTPPAAAP